MVVNVILVLMLVGALVALGFSVRLTRALRREEAYLRDLNDHQTEQARKMTALAQSWEKKFWSLHGAMGKLLGERDAWKTRYNESVSQHLNGQAILEQGITKSRASAVALAKAVNAERERRSKVMALCLEATEKGKPLDPTVVLKICGTSATAPLTDDEIPSLEGFPRGAVEAFHNNIRRWNEQAKASTAELKESLADDRAHWERHFAVLGAVAANPSLEPPSEAPPASESLEGMTVQEIREV